MAYLNLYGPFNDLGYGKVTQGVFEALLTKSILDSKYEDFHLSPIGPVQLQDSSKIPAIQKQALSVGWDRKAPSLAIWHEFDLNKIGGNKLVAFPGFETTKFNKDAIHYLSQMDAICVLSKWAKQVVIDNIGDKVPVHVTESAGELLVNETINSTASNSAFTFFTVGKLEVRKSQYETVLAYVKAFKDFNEDTRLICHCFNPFDRNFVATATRMLTDAGLKIVTAASTNSIIGVCNNAIVEIPKVYLTTERIFQLYKYGHVGVFPSKGEGWNLPLMEAMKSGAPCIATNYSGHTEFFTSEYVGTTDLLLNNFSMATANDGIFFKGDRGEWAIPNLDELVDKMKYAFNKYEDLKSRLDPTKLKEKFTWKNTTDKLLSVVDSVR